ncbi:MAG: DUF975 family protein [Hespellia sp.]|nr:DUF975 family protein [Hespellia sp.]
MSWSRRLLKTNAKKAVRQNYWRFIAVCFLVMFICGSGLMPPLLFQRNPAVEISQSLRSLADHLTADASMGELASGVSDWLDYSDTLLGIGVFWISIVLWCLYKIFIANIVRVNSKRFFMETRTYPKTSVKKIGYLYKGKDIKNTAEIMLCMYVCRFLWWFTIIGGIVKSYEYAMIPYILAENPDIARKDAFRLSKEMMHNKKIGLFILQMSFIPWFLLGIISMGLTNIFFFNAYMEATETEFYMMLRRDIVAQRSKSSKFFIDNYLENKPSEDEILINMFVLEKNYMPNLDSDEFSQNVYPMFLRGKDSKWYETPYAKKDDRNYHITTYILLFFLTSIIGWAANITIGLIKQGYVINAGILYGPWIPVVGITAVLVLLVGRRLMKHPLVNVTFITVFPSAVQYFYVWLIEWLEGTRYWDFSGYFLNLNGRICLSSVVAVGAFGSALFYLIGPELDEYLKQFPVRKKWKVCIALFILFLIDIGITIYITFFN